MIELFYSPSSTSSQRVMLALAEKGIDDWIGHKLDILKQDHLTPEYLALNPLGVIPTLIDGSAVITDSVVILEYLDETRPRKPHLVPADPVVRSHARAWCSRLDSTDALRVITFQKRVVPAFATLEPASFEKIASAHPTRAAWYRSMGQDGFDACTIDSALSTISKILIDAGQCIAVSKTSWLFGHAVSIADLVTLPLVERVVALGRQDLVNAVPALARWHAAMRARASYRCVYS
jgi:glutathione S-transferase